VFGSFLHRFIDRSSGVRGCQRGIKCTRIVVKCVGFMHSGRTSQIAKRVTKRINTRRLLEKKTLILNILNYLNI
jgi:hypothetical protein